MTRVLAVLVAALFAFTALPALAQGTSTDNKSGDSAQRMDKKSGMDKKSDGSSKKSSKKKSSKKSSKKSDTSKMESK